MPQNVRVTRGKAVDIPLRTFGRHSEQLRYVIKSLPAHGRLSEPRVVDREASIVTYQPPVDFAVKNDRFLFSVKTSVGVSAPVEVNIAIVDEAPVLSIPAALDFGSIPAGAGRQGVRAGGPRRWPRGRRAESARAHGRSRGAAVTRSPRARAISRSFAPAEAGFRGEIVFTSDREHSTAPDGTAAMPVGRARGDSPAPRARIRAAHGRVRNHQPHRRSAHLPPERRTRHAPSRKLPCPRTAGSPSPSPKRGWTSRRSTTR
jgi:hypothetical protein